MKTQTFFDLLNQNADKELIFEYAAGQHVPDNYHITEVKNVHVESVDCGGIAHDYDQTIIQLWVPNDEAAIEPFFAKKASKIFNLVDGIKPINKTTEIFFEYGNTSLPTAHYLVGEVKVEEAQIFVQLVSNAAQCKPQATANASNCCEPQTASNANNCC